MTTNDESPTAKLEYVQPAVIEHGEMVDRTKGTCSCQTEECGFKPAPEELL